MLWLTLPNIKLAYTIYEHVVTTSKKNTASLLQRGKICLLPDICKISINTKYRLNEKFLFALLQTAIVNIATYGLSNIDRNCLPQVLANL